MSASETLSCDRVEVAPGDLRQLRGRSGFVLRPEEPLQCRPHHGLRKQLLPKLRETRGMGAPRASRRPLGGDSRLAGRWMREGPPRGVSAQGPRLVPGEGGFRASCRRREASGEGWSEGPHPTPTPSLTDALPDVLGPLPPDAVDPDQEGVPRLQEVEQGGLQIGRAHV